LPSELFQHINYDKAYRANRMNGAQWVLAHPETFPELLDYCFEEAQSDLSHKACWVLEFVCLEKLELLYPHLDNFFEHMPLVKKDSSVRPLANLCEKMCIRYYKKFDPILREALTETHKTIMTECCFDWMISDQKVACQARAMTCLYYSGTEHEWIHPELQQIIELNIHQGSAGYKNRGMKTIEAIKKFQSSFR